MSLFVRVDIGFYTHRKTIRLFSKIGESAFWVPPRIWAYAASQQIDGIFEQYSAAELAMLVGYNKDATSMLQALIEAGFLDPDPLRIHDWSEYNGFHAVFSARAKKAAAARWKKESSKERRSTEIESESETEKYQASLSNAQVCLKHPATKNGESGEEEGYEMRQPRKGNDIALISKFYESARIVLGKLNQAADTTFRETDENLGAIAQRLAETGNNISAATTMVERQVKLWKGTRMAQGLNPKKLFGSDFDNFYGQRDVPLPTHEGNQNGNQRIQRTKPDYGPGKF